MSDDKKDTCVFARCPEHTHTLERVAMLEKGLASLERAMEENTNRMQNIHDTVTKEFKLIRDEISNGILRRYPAGIVFIITVLTGICAALLTALLD